jgi:uncharacterized protein with beta-barrel porin domain
MNIRAKRDSPLMNAAAVAAAKSRLRKMSRSSIGALPRCSISTNSGSRRAAAARLAITSVSSQPEMPPREIP